MQTAESAVTADAVHASQPGGEGGAAVEPVLQPRPPQQPPLKAVGKSTEPRQIQQCPPQRYLAVWSSGTDCSSFAICCVLSCCR